MSSFHTGLKIYKIYDKPPVLYTFVIKLSCLQKLNPPHVFTNKNTMPVGYTLRFLTHLGIVIFLTIPHTEIDMIYKPHFFTLRYLSNADYLL